MPIIVDELLESFIRNRRLELWKLIQKEYNIDKKIYEIVREKIARNAL
jgi:hypothetical protein